MTEATTLGAADDVLARLHEVGRTLARLFRGESARRQPVHTVYGGAHLWSADAAGKLGAVALRALETYAPDAATLAAALGTDAADTAGAAVIEQVYPRIVEKLRREPVEDFRIDFEDGYGNRPDAEEDGHAAAAAGCRRGSWSRSPSRWRPSSRRPWPSCSAGSSAAWDSPSARWRSS